MSYKQVMFRSAARDKILRGASQLADAIRVTLGPRSKAVLIQKKWGAPLVCNDGVTIASTDTKAIGQNRMDVATGDRYLVRELRDGVVSKGYVILNYEFRRPGSEELIRKMLEPNLTSLSKGLNSYFGGKKSK